jgi:FkbM family methyltransferase
MKKVITDILSRYPSLYRLALRASGSRNVEKMTYLRLVKDGDTVFDIGANRGDFTALFSNVVGPAGAVHAFEPVLPTFSALSERIGGECRFRNVTLNHHAIGDTEGMFQIQVPAGEFGQASLRSHTLAAWAKQERQSFDCQVLTLDSYVSQNDVKRLDFIKIDVEGAELPALRGGGQTLERFHPVIHCECLAAWTSPFDYTPADLVSYLRSHGYTHFYAGNLLPLHSPETEVGADDVRQNFVCSVKSL